MVPLTWTTGKPAKPGFDWYQVPGQLARVVEVVYDSKMKWLYVTQPSAYLDDLPDDEYVWAGPLEPTK